MTLRRVQRGLFHQFSVGLALIESGRGNAIEVASAQLTTGSGVIDLMEVDLSYSVAEAGSPTVGGHSTQLTGPPVFTAAGGPSGEDIFTLPVVDSSLFTIGDTIKTFDKSFPGGATFQIVDLPNGTEVVVHSAVDGMDIIDGDTIVEVDGTGDYVIGMGFQVDDYLTPQSPLASLILVFKTVVTGDEPAFTVQSTVVKDFNFELDLTGQAFRTG